MQNVNYELSQQFRQMGELKLIAWGGGQIWLPFIMVWFLLRACQTLITTRNINTIFLGDAVLSPLGVLLKGIFGKPVVVWAHGLDITYKSQMYQSLVIPCLRRVDKIVCISDNTKKECEKRGVESAKLTIIPNGVNVNVSHTELDKQYRSIEYYEHALNIPLNGKRILLTVGRLIERKGVVYFLKNIFPSILEQYQNAVYIVVGDGPCRSEIQTTITMMNLHSQVVLTGRLSQDMLLGLYRLAEIFVMPNIHVAGDCEGFGIVALEAGLQGLPVVASNVDGIAQAVIDGKNGFLIAYPNHDEFARRVLNLLDNEQNAKKIGADSREFIQHNFSWNNIAQKFLTQLSFQEK